jgi:hypothetical protein
MLLDLPDPDPSFHHQANHDLYCFITFYDFFSLKNDLNVPSKNFLSRAKSKEQAKTLS